MACKQSLIFIHMTEEQNVSNANIYYYSVFHVGLARE